jgi:hypothetical protein
MGCIFFVGHTKPRRMRANYFYGTAILNELVGNDGK